jgi:hypothetical protein
VVRGGRGGLVVPGDFGGGVWWAGVWGGFELTCPPWPECDVVPEPVLPDVSGPSGVVTLLAWRRASTAATTAALSGLVVVVVGSDEVVVADAGA